MSTHTGTFIRPTLGESVAGWVSLGWSKRAALRVFIGLHFRQFEAPGKGNRAFKRVFGIAWAARGNHGLKSQGKAL